MNDSTLLRRAFLRRLALLSGAPLLPSTYLRAIQSASTDSVDYRSLVCIYLGGGIDSYNTFVPATPTEHQRYAKIRRGLAIPRSKLHLIRGGAFGFHPAMPKTRQLYDEGKLAVVANVGPLFRPTTQASFRADFDVPTSLFSHSHQAETWQTLRVPAVGGIGKFGWGGELADRLASWNVSAQLPPSFSIQGKNLWQTGETTVPLGVDASAGLGKFRGFAGDSWPLWERGRTAAWDALLQPGPRTPLEAQAVAMLTTTRKRIRQLSGALAKATKLKTPFDRNNGLARQLRMVAKLISIRQQLGLHRQTFFVRLGGFDTHTDQAPVLARRLAWLDDGLDSFYRSLIELGVAKSVTAFTATEFGRSLTRNGDGTDHGWTAQHFVLGGSARGGAIYGTMPRMEIGGSTDAFRKGERPAGRLIPSQSVDQYGATLARWMGVTDPTELKKIFPNLANFTKKDLGFLT